MTASPLFDLSGRTAVITGSSRGIGLAIAIGLARAGASIVLNGVNPQRLEHTRAALADRLGEHVVAASAFDVTDQDQVRAGIDAIEANVGPIAILWAAGGLQINGIAPGYIHTEMIQAPVDDRAFNDWILGRTPAARWAPSRISSAPRCSSRPRPPTQSMIKCCSSTAE
jgi:gluconate 5-dehydrogenase